MAKQQLEREQIPAGRYSRFSPQTQDLGWAFLPYVLRRLSEHDWLLLNRSYKPLGHQSSDPWVVYEDAPSVITFATQPKEETLLAIALRDKWKRPRVKRDGLDEIYSVHLGAEHTDEYLARLAKLMQMTTLRPDYTETVRSTTLSAREQDVDTDHFEGCLGCEARTHLDHCTHAPKGDNSLRSGNRTRAAACDLYSAHPDPKARNEEHRRLADLVPKGVRSSLKRDSFYARQMVESFPVLHANLNRIARKLADQGDPMSEVATAVNLSMALRALSYEHAAAAKRDKITPGSPHHVAQQDIDRGIPQPADTTQWLGIIEHAASGQPGGDWLRRHAVEMSPLGDEIFQEIRDWFEQTAPSISPTATVATVRRQVRAWHDRLNANSAGPNQQLPTPPIPAVEFPIEQGDPDRPWMFEPITNTDDLAEHAARLEHCARSYCEKILREESWLYSVKDSNGDDRLTVEVVKRGAGFAALQAVGRRNRKLTRQERIALDTLLAKSATSPKERRSGAYIRKRSTME